MNRLARIGAFSFRRRRLVLGAWIGALVAAFALAGAFGGAFSADYNTPGSESKAAGDALAQRFGVDSTDTVDVVWRTADGTPAGFLKTAGALPGLSPAGEPEVSPDGKVAVARLPLTMLASDVPKATGERLLDMRAAAHVELGGQVIQTAQQGPISSEAIGIAVAALVLLIALGTVVAAGLPLVLALFGLGISSSLILLLAAILPTPDWSSTVAAMLGIGVGIDYALLILTRYRAALAAGAEPLDAISEAVGAAGRSVLIAGTTVVISLLGLFAMGLTYLYGVALAAIIAVLVVMAGAVTLLPALLGFAGRRIERLRLPVPRSSNGVLAARWSQVVQHRPWNAAIAGVAILLALASPVTGLRLGFPDAGNDPAGTTTRAAYTLVTGHFGAGANGPLLVVTPSDASERVASVIKRDGGIQSVTVSQPGLIFASPKTSPQATATEDLVKRLRDGRLGPDVLVGGRTASAIDQASATAARLPLFIGIVAGLSLLLLLVAFRSVTVALKAAILNLFSVAAAFGVVALLAQGGFFGQLIGIDTATPVPPFIPVIMFATLFGLSMDYEVFLLSRVRELWLRNGDTSRAVTEGLSRTAGVITAAAAIMVVVFGALALSPEVFLKLIGVGLATAVLVDATVVRMVLVPSVMQLLGERNWWMPRWLDRLVPGVELEAPAAA